ncbi:hypothetical protein [Amycolatopsis aidingensis]|uniref:hypothetical protein n=1 Tax=Amycolatopsis aidingensis TaxID=2842453 RepID=UPI001C0CA8B1|nr:hypothetical protein [Amycolatopsis aidingensis]
MRTPAFLRFLIAFLIVPLVLTGVPAGTAAAAVPDRWGFAYLDDPTPPAGYVPDTSRQWGSWKSAFPGSWATVDQLGVGIYRVRLPHIGGPGGVAHVMAVNPDPTWCQLMRWGHSGADELVYVRCHKPGGGPADSRFTVMYSASSGAPAPPAGDYGYVFAGPAAAIHAQYNSSGAGNGVGKIGPGLWQVKLPGLGLAAHAGNLQATAVESQQGARCKVARWQPAAAGQLATVRCVDAASNPLDVRWTLSYHLKRSVYGAVSPPKAFAYLWNTLGFAPPDTSFNSQGGVNTVVSAGLGMHLVTFPKVGMHADHVQVTAYGAGPEYCGMNYPWLNHGGNAYLRNVICFDAAGARTDTRSLVTYSSRH